MTSWVPVLWPRTLKSCFKNLSLQNLDVGLTYSLDVIGTFKKFVTSPVAALANNGQARKKSESPSMESRGEGKKRTCFWVVTVENLVVVGKKKKKVFNM